MDNGLTCIHYNFLNMNSLKTDTDWIFDGYRTNTNKNTDIF
jgi:hypothetical protein